MHYLLKKKSMDAMNEALNKPTEYPAADKDYDHPMWFKGTEPEQIKHASRFRGSSRKAEVEMHTEPRVLPPRNELRSHLDQDIKDEIKADKEATLTPPTRRTSSSLLTRK